MQINIELTCAQARAIGQVAAGGGTVLLQQTKPGKYLHLYVQKGKRQWHVAKNGNCAEIGVTINDERNDEWESKQ